MSTDEALRRGRELMAEAAGILVLTGSGISAESGVPTFRGEEGLWREHRPEELATPGAFRRDPRLVWEWYQWRRETVASCEPNAAHRALARLALRGDDVRIVTQNVDGLHGEAARLEAGSGGDPEPALPVELHGSLFRVRCTGCGLRREHREAVDATSRETLPRCPECGELLRPDVVWFGESLEREKLEAAFDAARGAQLCLVVGTSAVVQPAASVAVATLRAGGRLVEVNPEATPLSDRADVTIRAGAAGAVPALVEPAAYG